MFRTIDRYEETGLGLPYPVILLNGAEEEVDEETGDVVGISVPDLEQLVASVALVRAMCPVQLSGAEVRFIRQAIGMSAKDFAEALTLDKATFSRWEHEKQLCGGWADKQVRQIAVIKLASLVPHLTIEPDAVVSMKIQPAVPEWHPNIEMRRVPVSAVDAPDDGEAWDRVELPRAA